MLFFFFLLVFIFFFFVCLCLMMLFFFFFFSSRRRHTRCLSDWSSDVCSSDLASRDRGHAMTCQSVPGLNEPTAPRAMKLKPFINQTAGVPSSLRHRISDMRSEERRVGKECRSRWSA